MVKLSMGGVDLHSIRLTNNEKQSIEKVYSTAKNRVDDIYVRIEMVCTSVTVGLGKLLYVSPCGTAT